MSDYQNYGDRPAKNIMPVRPPSSYQQRPQSPQRPRYQIPTGYNGDYSQQQNAGMSGDYSSKLNDYHQALSMMQHPSFQGNPMEQAMRAAKWYKQQPYS